jgi:Tfp pilus assembly protein PilP
MVQKARSKLTQIAVFFPLFAALAPAVPTFSATEPGTGKKVESAGEVEVDDAVAVTRKFSLVNLKDPFKSFILEQETPRDEPERKPKTYLETVDLSQLELMAVIVSPEDRWAMLRDAKGIGYVVKNGTPVGIDGGRVHEIRPGEVVIRSAHKNAEGQSVMRETVKRLVQ